MIDNIYGYGLFVLNIEKTKLENMIELRLDNGELEKDSTYIRMYREQIASINANIEVINKHI